MVREGVPYRQTLPTIGGSQMGEALKAWVLKQTAKAPVAPALSAWATAAYLTPSTQAGIASATGTYLHQLTTATYPNWGSAGGSGYDPPTSQPAPGYSSTATLMVLTPAQLRWKK